MRKLFLFISFCVGVAASAQNEKSVVIKAGTIVPIQSVHSVKAADVEFGQTVDFKVVKDVMVDNVCAVPRGTLAVVTGIFLWPCLFIPGTKAVMPAGYEVLATVASNTVVTLK